MNRYAKAMLVIASSVAIGACGKAKIITIPAPAQQVAAIVEEPEAPFAEEDIELLPIRTLDLGQPPIEPVNLDPVPTCDIAAIIAQTATDRQLAAYPSNAGLKMHSYFEVRFDYLSPREDYELNIGVRVLDLETCTTEVIGIKKTYGTDVIRVPYHERGGIIWKEERKPVASLVPPAGWNIEVIRRAQGVEWNSWGTELHITEPAHRVVVGVKWPNVTGHGKNRITPVTYVPYSRELHLESLITDGQEYLDQVASQAFSELRRLGVKSKAYPGMLVSDVPAIELDLVTSLAVIEHMDPGEFALDPKWTADRIHVVVGANRERTAAYTCSGADACGLMQFIEPTYRDMRRGYPAAKLLADVNAGRREHLNAMKATILLLDSNFATFREALGAKEFEILMADRKMRRELSRSSYNTGAGRTVTVYSIHRKKGPAEWTEAKGKRCSKADKYAECLLLETKGYLAKGRYIDELWRLDPLAVHP